MFASLCSNYEGNKKVKEVKVIMMVQQNELFRMKEDEDIKTMYLGLQTLVSRLQTQKKSDDRSSYVILCMFFSYF